MMLNLEREKRTDAIREKAKGRWRQILVTAGIPEQLLTKDLGPCPVCGGNTRFRYDDKYGHGNWVCHHCDRKANQQCGSGDGFRLLQLFNQWTFPQAVDFAEECLGGSVAQLPVKQVAIPSREDELKKAFLKSKGIWEGSIQIQEGDPVSLYLKSRGIVLHQYPKAIRFHKGLDYFIKDKGKYRKLGSFPAMVAALQHPNGKFAGVHVTYLTEDGRKAPINSIANTGLDYPDRKMMAKGAEGAAIRLMPAGTKLGVAEGIETAWSASILFGMPVWPTTSAGLLQNFVVPQGVTFVEIFMDADIPDQHGIQRGQQAAKGLAARLKQEGVGCRIRAPMKLGKDFNNLLLERNNYKVAC